MKIKKSLAVRFYSESEDAREPVREWLCEELSENERILVGADIRIVQDHWPKVKDVKPKLIDYIRDDVWEIKTTLKNHWHRVFFGFVSGEIVLLHAIKKQTNQTPSEDVEKAIIRLKKASAAAVKEK